MSVNVTFTGHLQDIYSLKGLVKVTFHFALILKAHFQYL